MMSITTSHISGKNLKQLHIFCLLILGQFPGEHGLVAPGMSCHYAVRFAPDSLRDFHDEIKIQTLSTVPITVPLLGRRPPPKLTRKKMYNQLGTCGLESVSGV